MWCVPNGNITVVICQTECIETGGGASVFGGLQNQKRQFGRFNEKEKVDVTLQLCADERMKRYPDANYTISSLHSILSCSIK